MVRSVPLLAALALVVAGCDGVASRAQPVTLSFTTRPASGAAPSPGASADLQIGSGNNSLTVSSAQVVLSKIELSGGGTCDTAGEEDDCDELEAGPALVSLPLDGSTTVALDASVPPGTYSALDARLDAVRLGEDEPGAAAFLQDHPDFQGVSVAVAGVFTDSTGQTHPFTFTLEADAEIEAEFQPPVTVGSGTSNLTISVNLPAWFTDMDGKVIDPTNPANAELIAHNIQQSFHAFEDDNHDGTDDHEAGDSTSHS